MNRGRFLTTATLTIVLIFGALISTNVISSNPSKYETPARALNSASSATIYVDPPNMTETSGTDFIVDMKIENVTDLYALEAKLEWDPKLLNVVNVAQGDFLITEEPGSTSWNVGGNQTEGWISVTYYLLSGAPGIGVNGSGTLAKITFHAADPGECILHFYDTKIFKPVSVASPPNLGDVNGDLKVDMKDIGDVAKAWGSSVGQPRYNPNADFNKDGFVDLFDLLCAVFNFGHAYAETDTARQPTEIIHEVQDGNVTILPFGVVTWKWLDYCGNPIWLTANITYIASFPLENFSFNRTLNQTGFNINASASGFCNVTIPKLLMDGGFKVLINDTETASILTWNKTHTSVYFTYDQGLQNTAIAGEIVTRIRNIKDTENLPITDINGDGIVNILDISAVAVCNKWDEDR